MSWDEYFLAIAEDVARKSKDPHTKVGAVIVDEDNTIRVTGFNGVPRGVDDRDERLQRPEKYNWVSHAEMNCVAQAARVGVSTRGCTIVVTHAPCSICARLIVQAGVKRVVIGHGTTSMLQHEFDTADTMFREAGVVVTQCKTAGVW